MTPLPRIMHAGYSAALVPANRMMIKSHENPLDLRLRVLSCTGIFCKSQTNTIHTMTLVRGSRIPLTLEYMAKVTPTVATHDLCPLHAECAINMPSHSTRDGIKVCWPTTARFELVVGSVKRRIATSAIVDAFGRIVGIVFTSTSTLGTLFTENTKLFCSHSRKQISTVYCVGVETPWCANLGSKQLSTRLRSSGRVATWLRLLSRGWGWS